MNKLRHQSYLIAFVLLLLGKNASAYSVAEITFHKLKSNINELLKAQPLGQVLFMMPPPPSGSISVRVNASTDDAEQNLATGSVSTSSSSLELVQDGTSNQQTGMRFKSITIPQGAIITSAYIEFIAKTTNSSALTLTLSGQAADNPAAFSTSTNNISTRAKTTATVTWSPQSWTSTGAAYQTADISTIVQEIVNRPGWASGNSMVIMANGPTSATRSAQSYDGASSSAPLLVVNYTLVEICGNGLDDDGDGLIDGADLDCGSFCPTGSLSLERWLGLSGTSISNLTSSSNYPSNPSETASLTSFDGPDNYADNYGTRVRGYITPSLTGTYSFNLTSDDAGELYLSPDANPANKVLISSVSGYTGTTEYTKYSSQTSASLTLVAGQNYYVELLHKEGGGGDHFQVYWKTPASSSWTIVPGGNLRPFGCSEICGNGVDDDGDGQVDGADADCGNFCTTGKVNLERWLSIGGTAISDLTANANYPNNPTEVATLTSLDSPDDYADNFGQRARGYISPTETGIYTFNLTSDDAGEFYLSTDANAANKKLVASVAGWTNPTEYTKYASQTSYNILLMAGRNYYFEVLNKEGGGGDHFQVYWKTPSNANWNIVPGTNLRPFSCSETCGNGIDDDGDGFIDCNCDLIANGEFDNGLSGWLMYVQSGSSASGALDNSSQLSGVNSGAVTINSTSGTDWHIQAYQAGLSIQSGKTYTVSFQSKSTGSRPMGVVLQQSVSPYTVYWSKSVSLTSTANTFTFDYPCNVTNNGQVALIFNMGQSTKKVWIDKISVTPKCAVEICGNGLDDDGDGLVDCADSDCKPEVTVNPSSATVCQGGNTSLTASATGDMQCDDYSASVVQVVGDVSNPNACLSVPDAVGTYLYSVNGNYTRMVFDMGAVKPAGTRICVKIRSATQGVQAIFSGWILESGTPETGSYTLLGTQSTVSNVFMDFCFTLPTANRYFKISQVSGGPFYMDALAVDCDNNGLFTYQWSSGGNTPTITVTPSGTTTYTVTVTNSSGCTATATSSVTVNALPSPSITGTNTICAGASTTLTASGGGTYLWSNGATAAAITVSPASNATYTVTVTNASGCTATASRTVTVSANPTASISGTTTICKGTSTTLTASGGGTYLWNNGASSAAVTVAPATTTTYIVTVTNASGCTATASKTVTVNTCVEICNNGTDDDGDGLVDCADPDCKRITLATPVVSSCIDQPLQDVATVSVQVSWINAPANDQIEVSIYGQTERINTGAGVTSPQTVVFTVPANGAANQTITANWRNTTTLCASTATFNAPMACSSDQVGCNILYLCGLDKPNDGDPWDHGFMAYLDEVNGTNTVSAALTKADASGMGTYDVNSPNTPITVNLNNYSLVVISATTEASIAPALVAALKNYTGAVMNCNYDILDDLGMSTTTGSYQFQSNLYIDNSISKEIYNFNNDISPTYTKVFTRGKYTSAADAYLWTNAGEQAAGTNGVYFVYASADAMPGVAAGHGRRVFLGYHNNGLYANAQNGGALPAPVSSYFVPAKHLTLEGKYYLDLAILEATKACNAEICNNGIDDNDNGLVDCQETVCGLPAISNIAKTNATNCPGQNNGQITITATGTSLEYSINNGATYQNSNIFTGLVVGTYNVRVRNSVTGCFVNYASNPVQITGIVCLENCTNGIDDDGDGLVDCLDNDCKPSANAGTDANLCLGASYTLSANAMGGTGPYTYTWDHGLGTGQTKSVTPTATTTYTVTISSAGGCTSTDAMTITITPCTEICNDGLDNDGDGLIDCADPDCIVTAAPHLVGDVYQACPGILFQEQPIFNDENLQNAVYSIYSNPAKGSVSINNQGVFTYTPNNSSCGVDSFRYQVCNAISGCCDHTTVVLNLGDQVPPSLKNVPADITINCDDPVPAPPVVFGVDACPGIFVAFNEVNNQVNAGSCQQYTIVRTWTATDNCGNAGSASQTITVKDAVAPELFRVYTLANGHKLVAGVVSNAETNWRRINFPISFDETPVVFSQVISSAGLEPVISRHQHIDNDGFELRIQEEEVADGVHSTEQVAWMALEPGFLSDGSNLQAGYLTGVTQALKLLSYPKAFAATPVVIAATQTFAEADPVQIRFSNSTGTSTQLKLEEEQSKDVEVAHADETVAYLAAYAGNIQDQEGSFIGNAGTVTLTNSWKLIPFDRKYSKPVVLFGGQPMGNDPATIRVRNVTPTSFEARIEEWQYLNGNFPSRTVNYFVVEGSIPAYVENPCSEKHAPILPGINLFSTDNCDAQVAMNFSESSTMWAEGMIYTKVWTAADDCGNLTTVTRNDTCKMAAVRLRATLAGAMIGTASSNTLMRDELRTKNLVPLVNPYTLVTEGQYAAPTTHTIPPSMLQETGNNAIVDWIMVEIRDSLDSKKVIKSVPCLLQRDGDIINEYGSDIISFRTIPEGYYYVYIKHRNHLGMISKTPVYLSTYDVPLVDFSVYGSHVFNASYAGQISNGRYLNWAGDLNNDNKVIYQGPTNDVFLLFSDVMIDPENAETLANYIVTGYKDTDINLDGKSIFQGPGNDRSMLLLNTILSHPANSYLLANFIATIVFP